MSASSPTYEEVQQQFDTEVGAIPGLGEGESTIAGLGGPVPAPSAHPAPLTAFGWPVEFWELLHVAAFSALGEKWRLTSEQAKLLGAAGKSYFDTVLPAILNTPLAAYLSALGTVALAKVGTDYLEKLKHKASASATPKAGNTATGTASAESEFSESPGLGSPISFVVSAPRPAAL